MGGCFTASHFLRVPQRRNAANPFLLFADTEQAIFSCNLLQLYFEVPGTIWAPQYEISVYDIHLLGTTSPAPWAPFRRFAPSDRATRKKRNPLKPLRLKGFVAEAVGFEPTCPCGQPHFECGSLQPLRYVSEQFLLYNSLLLWVKCKLHKNLLYRTKG